MFSALGSLGNSSNRWQGLWTTTIDASSGITASNLGIEFTESDTNPACAAGNFNIFADLSESKLKKCMNGVATDLDTGAGAAFYQTVEDEGGALTQRAVVNFTGAGITCTDSGGKTVCNVTSGGGSGDVVGPASAIDGSPACFDGVTGKLLQDCGAIANGGLEFTEGDGSALTAASGKSILYADSTHRIRINNNNSGLSTLAQWNDNLSVFATTTSSQLIGVISDEVGSGTKIAKFDSVAGNSGVAAQAATTRTTGKQVQFDANGNLEATATDIGAGAGEALATGSTGVLYDEFCGNTAATNAIGNLRWAFTNGGSGSPTVQYQGADQAVPHTCVIRLLTNSTTDGHSGFLVVSGNNNTGVLGELGASSYAWDSYGRFSSINQGANVNVRYGFMVGAVYAADPVNSFGVRCLASDTNWMYEIRVASTPTTHDTGIACDTGWRKIRIRSDASGTIKITLYTSTGTVAAAERSFCSSGCDTTVTPPSGDMHPYFMIQNSGTPASTRQMSIDFWSFSMATGR